MANLDQILKENINQPAGAFRGKQAEALRRVFEAIIDAIEAIEEEIAE